MIPPPGTMLSSIMVRYRMLNNIFLRKNIQDKLRIEEAHIARKNRVGKEIA